MSMMTWDAVMSFFSRHYRYFAILYVDAGAVSDFRFFQELSRQLDSSCAVDEGVLFQGGLDVEVAADLSFVAVRAAYFGGCLAVADEDDAPDLVCDVSVVGDDDDGSAQFAVDGSEQVEYFAGGGVVEFAGGFVR